ELGDDLDRADPLHLLEPELDLVAQPDRRAVRDRERFAVHLEREQRQLAVHQLERVHVVIGATVGPLTERVEDDVARVGGRLDEREQVAHGDAAPLRDPRPPLDAEVLRDLLLVRHRTQFVEREVARVGDEAVHVQAVVREARVDEPPELVRVGHAPVQPEVGRDVGSVYWRGLGSMCSNRPCTGPVTVAPTRCTTRGWRNVNGVAAIHAATTIAIHTTYNPKPAQLLVSLPSVMWLRFVSRPVVHTIAVCMKMKTRNQHSTRKWIERATCELRW